MITEFKAQYIRNALLASAFEFLSKGGKISFDPIFNVEWNGFSWVIIDESDGLCPGATYLIMHQFLSDEIDGVDRNSTWAWLQESTLSTQLDVSHSFIGGIMSGWSSPFANINTARDEFDTACQTSYEEYTGSSIVPAYCESSEDFFEGFEIGRGIYFTLTQYGAIK